MIINGIRIITTNSSRLTDIAAIQRVMNVMQYGKVSNNEKCYSYVTAFGDNVHVSCRENKNGFTFTVYDSDILILPNNQNEEEE